MTSVCVESCQGEMTHMLWHIKMSTTETLLLHLSPLWRDTGMYTHVHTTRTEHIILTHIRMQTSLARGAHSVIMHQAAEDYSLSMCKQPCAHTCTPSAHLLPWRSTNWLLKEQRLDLCTCKKLSTFPLKASQLWPLVRNENLYQVQ